MWIKIKGDLYNLSNFCAIEKMEFEINFSYFQRILTFRFDTQEECNREFERIEKLLLEGK
jgi:hypothetical protein